VSVTPARAEAFPPNMLDHGEFVAAWRAGEIEVAVDPRRAASLVSSRMLLPFVAMAIIGIGIGLVLWGWLWTGIAIGAVGVLGPRLIKRSAAGMVLQQVEHDDDLYRAAVACGAVIYRKPMGGEAR
jgi:hypothetical protein